jgi:hypothetical protein
VSRPSDVNGYWSVDYGKLTPLLVQSVQDQQAQVVGLSLKLNETGLLIDQMGQVLGEVQQDSDQQEEKSIKELLNYYTTLSDIAWTFVSEVIFNAKAKFMASVEFVKDVTFNGSVRLSKESAGTVVIPANTTKAKIAFDRVFSQVPNVYLTNKDQFSGNLSIAEVTKEYFVIELSEGQANDISIQWLAILAEQTNEDRVEVLETNGDGSEQNEEPSEQTDSDDGVQTEQSNVQTTKQNTEQNGVVEPTPTPVPTQETNYQTTQESENLNNTASSSAETTHSGEVVE